MLRAKVVGIGLVSSIPRISQLIPKCQRHRCNELYSRRHRPWLAWRLCVKKKPRWWRKDCMKSLRPSDTTSGDLSHRRRQGSLSNSAYKGYMGEDRRRWTLFRWLTTLRRGLIYPWY